MRYTARCPTQRDKVKHGTPGGGAMLLAAFSSDVPVIGGELVIAVSTSRISAICFLVFLLSRSDQPCNDRALNDVVL